MVCSSSNQIKWNPLTSTHSTVEKYLPGAISHYQHYRSTSPWISQFLSELHKQACACSKCGWTNGWMVCNASKVNTMPTGPSAHTSPFPSTCAFSSSTHILSASFSLVLANGQISCGSQHPNPWFFVGKRPSRWWWCHQHINLYIVHTHIYIYTWASQERATYTHKYTYMYTVYVWNISCKRM